MFATLLGSLNGVLYYPSLIVLLIAGGLSFCYTKSRMGRVGSPIRLLFCFGALLKARPYSGRKMWRGRPLT